MPPKCLYCGFRLRDHCQPPSKLCSWFACPNDRCGALLLPGSLGAALDRWVPPLKES